MTESSSSFALHERLAADTTMVADWPLCRVLLMNERTWPWLILVPRRPGLREWHELAPADGALLSEEIVRASRGLAAAMGADKINIGALGNMVPQLHVHAIARFRTDPAWPGPVWSFQQAVPYAAEERAALLARLRPALG